MFVCITLVSILIYLIEINYFKKLIMKISGLEKRIKSLSSLPNLKRKNKDMSFMDEYSNDKIHDICEACHNIVHMKFPLESKKKNQLKKKLAPIKKEVRQLGNPKLLIKTKRKLLKNPQVGFGVFTALASFVIPALISLITSK